MKKSKNQLLKEAYSYCNIHNKSMEFTLQYMQDYANTSPQIVLYFLRKEEKKARRLDKIVHSEAEHFMNCNTCGQAFDMRDLESVIYHEQPNHKPTISN